MTRFASPDGSADIPFIFRVGNSITPTPNPTASRLFPSAEAPVKPTFSRSPTRQRSTSVGGYSSPASSPQDFWPLSRSETSGSLGTAGSEKQGSPGRGITLRSLCRDEDPMVIYENWTCIDKRYSNPSNDTIETLC